MIFFFAVQDELDREMEFLKKNHEHFATNVLLTSNENRDTIRGFLLLPEIIDASFIHRPDAFHLDKNLSLHMSCVNITSKKNKQNFIF